MNKVEPLIQEDGPCDYSFPCSEYHERCQSSYNKMKDENEDLRVLLSQHSTHWRAVAAALGGISCGGVDVPVTDPTGTAGSIIAGIHRFIAGHKEAVTPSSPVLNAEPCPFCACTNMYLDSMQIDDEDNFFLVCTACGAEGPTSALPDIAVMLWDIRQPHAEGGQRPVLPPVRTEVVVAIMALLGGLPYQWDMRFFWADDRQQLTVIEPGHDQATYQMLRDASGRGRLVIL